MRQGLDDRECHRGHNSPQQVGPGAQGVGPELETVEVPVGQNQHVRPERGQSLGQQGTFIGGLTRPNEAARAGLHPLRPANTDELLPANEGSQYRAG